MSGARSDREPDPLGKRALFWVPSAEEAGNAEAAGAKTVTLPVGKRALYSGTRLDDEPVTGSENPLAGRGSFTVACKRCGQTSRAGLLDMVIFQFPVGIWLPGRRFDHRMTCPSCRTRAWCSVTLRRR